MLLPRLQSSALKVNGARFSEMLVPVITVVSNLLGRGPCLSFLSVTSFYLLMVGVGVILARDRTQ